MLASRVQSDELDRFLGEYLAENEWTSRPLSSLLARSRGVGAALGLQIGRWFFENGLQTPIGGIDETTGEDLPPRAAHFAGLAGMNTAFADVATSWARIDGRIADPHANIAEMLAWLRVEREDAVAEAARDDLDDQDIARASGRAWALREASLWLEAAANRLRLPWTPPRHQA